MIEELETLRTVERQMSYDLETEKNERRRLQQKLEMLDRDLASTAVNGALAFCRLIKRLTIGLESTLLRRCLDRCRCGCLRGEIPNIRRNVIS